MFHQIPLAVIVWRSIWDRRLPGGCLLSLFLQTNHGVYTIRDGTSKEKNCSIRLEFFCDRRYTTRLYYHAVDAMAVDCTILFCPCRHFLVVLPIGDFLHAFQLLCLKSPVISDAAYRLATLHPHRLSHIVPPDTPADPLTRVWSILPALPHLASYRRCAIPVCRSLGCDACTSTHETLLRMQLDPPGRSAGRNDQKLSPLVASVYGTTGGSRSHH